MVLLRIPLILLLVWPSLALPAPGVAGGPLPACVADACCVVVEAAGCCATPIPEHLCGRTGDECRCHLQPEDAPRPPEAPRPQGLDDLPPILATPVVGVVEAWSPERTRPRPTPPAIHRSHHRTRALLCIWRT